MTREEAIKSLEDAFEYRDRYCNKHDIKRNALTDALDMAVSALRKQGDKDTNVPIKWISVQEKLPESNDKVLAFTLSGKYAVARYDQRRQCWIAAGNLTVTHWMPLPAPPKEEA